MKCIICFPWQAAFLVERSLLRWAWGNGQEYAAYLTSRPALWLIIPACIYCCAGIFTGEVGISKFWK